MLLSRAKSSRAVSVLCTLLLVVPFALGMPHNTKSSSSSKTTGPATSKKTSSSHPKSTHHGKKAKKSSRKPKGQQAIDSDRTREIQSALIREHYLSGEPTGTWDAQTKAALTKFQGDNGWQTKVLPDSRALIKLGLGPSKEGLLNPESAAIGNSHELGAEKVIPGGSDPHK